MSSRQFDRTIRRALERDFLQKALIRATTAFKSMRTGTVSDLADFQALRQKAAAAKNRVLSRLDHYLTRLESSVTQAGGRVFWAADGQEAIDYVLRLAREKGVQKVVKGKSMTTEEIHFNPALIAAGLEVMETDLGEYIIQLCGERPSHLVGPAIHKTKEEIGLLFQEKIGLPYTDQPEVMTQAVRRKLRTYFLEADMGISGANFAIAETGTIVLLENEGNIRMSTTWPRVHVAIMGIEKVVADQVDLAPLLQILPISATGQRLSTYVSCLTGPAQNPGEGPEEFHLILLDGFRTRVLADVELREVLRCIRCGACLNVCPVWQLLGGHAYPWVYSGPLGIVLTAAAKGPKFAADIIGASTLCQACREVCPVMIDLPKMIMVLRRRLAKEELASGLTIDALGQAMALPAGYDLVTRLVDLGARTALDSQGQTCCGPAALKSLMEDRAWPKDLSQPFHRSHLEGKKK